MHSVNPLLFIDFDAGTLLLLLLVPIALFFILRAVMLWYWKVNIIVSNQEKQNELLHHLVHKANGNRRNARTKYLSALAMGDNKLAYECLLYLILHDLTDPELNEEETKDKYTSLKARYAVAFNKLGYSFPDYPFPSI